MNTNDIGRMSELKVAIKYISLGYKVLQPLNKDGIYDLVIEKDGVFSKIQVKTMVDKGDYYVLKNQTVVQTKKGTISKSYTEGDFDYLVGVNHYSGDIIQLPFKDCTKGGMHFRKVPPKNNQKNVKFVSDYKI